MKKILHIVLGGLLTVLGFGCTKDKDKIEYPRAMYGQPHADYKLIGNVKDADSNPINGIRVIFKPDATFTHPYANDTLFTDVNGHFQTDKLKSQNALTNYTNIVFEDIDGIDNGFFKSKTLQANDLIINQTKKGDGWYLGSFTIQADTKLERSE